MDAIQANMIIELLRLILAELVKLNKLAEEQQ